ncbi:MAG: VCBS repeat-containing protein [Treponema sp.]|jgi:hypothetical protein|nr:VCBS repeat-containing protein [Treponema sp.]
MLKNLGVDINPGLPAAPNAKSYDPATSIGPVGRVFSFPKREIFAVGYGGINGKSHALYEDFGNLSSLFLITGGQDSKNDASWAAASHGLLKKSIAADLDGDGLDEVVIVTLMETTNKILISKGVYKNGSLTITEAGTWDLPEQFYDMLMLDINRLQNGDYHEFNDNTEKNEAYVWNYLSYNGWKLIAADLNGDGKQECVLTLPGKEGAYMYILDHNLARVREWNLIQEYGLIVPEEDYRRYVPMVTAADYDQDGKDELCFMLGAICSIEMWEYRYQGVPFPSQVNVKINGAHLPNFTASYVVLDDGDADFAVLDTGYVSTLSSISGGTVISADFTGDGLPDTVFFGPRSNTENYLVFLKTTLNSRFEPDFTPVASASITSPVTSSRGPVLVESGSSGRYPNSHPPLAAGDVDGDGRPELFAGNRLWKFDSGGNRFEQMSLSDTDGVFDNPATYEYYDIVTGDVTGDRKDDMVLFSDGGWVEIFYYASGTDQHQSIRLTTASPVSRGTGCLPNVDNDSFILRDTGQRELLFSDPQVIAVLASPPYYAGINGDGDGGTSFGYSKSSGTTSSNSTGFSVGVSVGFEWEAPFGIAKAEFETAVTDSFGWTQSSSRELSESWGWNTPVAQDLVIFTAIPFDVYYYEVLLSPPGGDALPGDIMAVNVPRKLRYYHAPLSGYNASVPEEHRVTVNHTLGVPGSYFTTTQRNAQKTAAGNKGLFSTNTQMTAGSGAGSTTINIENVTGTDSGFSFEHETEISAKAGAGGVMMGVSSGFSYGYETTTSVSNGTWIEGTVPAIPSVSYSADKDFDWGLMAYPRRDSSQSYVFVTYWVAPH